MSQVISRSVGEEAAEPLGGLMKAIQQTLATNFLVLDHVDDYFGSRLKISQLLGELPDLLRITDQLYISISLDLGQLLHNICVTIHNICQISHIITLSQQQAL